MHTLTVEKKSLYGDAASVNIIAHTNTEMLTQHTHTHKQTHMVLM